MRPITYVVGNASEFKLWAMKHDVTRIDLINVRHVFDWSSAQGLNRPVEPYRVIILESASFMAIEEMERRGFNNFCNASVGPLLPPPAKWWQFWRRR